MKCKLVNKPIRSNYTVELLRERGLADSEIQYFLNVPDDSYLQNPSMLENVKEGFEYFDTMVREMGENDHIAVVVDSDVDGFTSAAIFVQYLRKFNKEVQVDSILHEGKGHGLEDTIDKILDIADKNSLWYVILPDSGSNDYKYHEILKENKIQTLVLDHHLVEPNTQFSDSAVIINNQLSPNYWNNDLSGAGVTWQFCRYCDEIYKTNYANELIDLAALGIVSDMMSMLSLENRYIVCNGFKNINNYFFQALCEKQSFSMGGKVNPTTVAFYITPLINAMIRTGTQEEKERCFQAFINGHQMVPSLKRGAKGTYEEVAIESARECTNARSKQNRILDKAEEQLEIKINKYDLLSNKILFIRLDEEDFPSEINGLIAMRLAARYKRPAIVARLNSEGEIKGSSRGLNESELKSFKQFMDESGYFEFTAGHDNACGIGILDKNLSAFHTYANEALKDIDFGENSYDVNFERIAADQDIDELICDIAGHEDLFGQGNLEPLIHIKDINLTKKDIAVIGKNADTVRIEKFGITYMQFHAKEIIKELAQYDNIKLEVVGRANLNFFAGKVTPQIFITDYQIEDGALGF